MRQNIVHASIRANWESVSQVTVDSVLILVCQDRKAKHLIVNGYEYLLRWDHVIHLRYCIFNYLVISPC